jgi:hypothetical protein
MSLTHLRAIIKSGIDLNEELVSGMSLMHLSIVDRACSTFILNGNRSLETTTPIPWHFDFPFDLAFMASMFRYFRKNLAEEDFSRIAKSLASSRF